MRAGLLLVAVIAGACVAAVGALAGSPPSACAVAWNDGAGPALRAAIAAAKPRGAFIDSRVGVSVDRWTKAGSSSSTSEPGCSIQFVLRNGRTLTVWGAWTGRRITTWAGPVPSNRPLPVPSNGTVHPDGTVGFHG